MTLEPGDVVITGTPAAQDMQRFPLYLWSRVISVR